MEETAVALLRFCLVLSNRMAKIGFLDQKLKFWAQNTTPLLDSNHVLATTGKSCSKKKSAFAQIIKGGNVILGDFLG